MKHVSKKMLAYVMAALTAATIVSCGQSVNVNGDSLNGSKFDGIKLTTISTANGIEIQFSGDLSHQIELERKVEFDSDFASLVTLPENTKKYLDQSVVALGVNNKIGYRARLIINGTPTNWSAIALGIVQDYLNPPTVPGAPVVNAIATDAFEVILPPKNVLTQGVRLKIKEVVTPPATSVEKTVNLALSVTDYIAQNGKDGLTIAAGKKYQVVVVHYNPKGEASSTPVQVTTLTAPANPTAPGIPTMVSVLRFSADKIRARWNAPTTGSAVQKYILWFCKNSGCQLTNIPVNFTLVNNNISSTTLLYDFTIPADAINGDMYGFAVQASNATGTSNPSNVLMAAIFNNVTVPPGAPELISVAPAANGKYDLLWNEPTSGDQWSSYKVYRGRNGVCDQAVIPHWTLAAVVGSSVISYLDTPPGFVANDRICYAIIATNAAGNSDASNSIELIYTNTPTPPPNSSPVLNQVYQVMHDAILQYGSIPSGSTGVEIWKGNSAADCSGAPNANWKLKATASAGSTSYSVSLIGNVEDSTVCFAIRAKTAGGTGPYSNVISFTVGSGGMAPGAPLLINADPQLANHTFKIALNVANYDGIAKEVEVWSCFGTSAQCDVNNIEGTFTLRMTASAAGQYAQGTQVIITETTPYPPSGTGVWHAVRETNSTGAGAFSNVLSVMLTYN